MIWGGGWEGGSALGTHVHPWLIHVNVWQNQYSIIKQNKVKIKIKKITYNDWHIIGHNKQKLLITTITPQKCSISKDLKT